MIRDMILVGCVGRIARKRSKCPIQESSTLHESDAYKNMSEKEFKKVLKKMTDEKKTEVVKYIAETIYEFVQEGKDVIKIPYHFE